IPALHSSQSSRSRCAGYTYNRGKFCICEELDQAGAARVKYVSSAFALSSAFWWLLALHENYRVLRETDRIPWRVKEPSSRVVREPRCDYAKFWQGRSCTEPAYHVGQQKIMRIAEAKTTTDQRGFVLYDHA